VIAGFEARDFMAGGFDEQYLSRERVFGAVEKQFGRADLVLARSGERHRRLRRALSIVYSRQGASAFVPGFVDAVREHVARWEPGARLGVYDQARRLAFAQYGRAIGLPSLTMHYRDFHRVRVRHERGRPPVAVDGVSHAVAEWGPIAPHSRLPRNAPHSVNLGTRLIVP
jgi:cytochrome P450